MRVLTSFLTAILILPALALGAAAEPKIQSKDLVNEEDKMIFVMGYSVARNLRDYSFDEREMAILQAGIRAYTDDETLPWNADELGRKVGELRKSRVKESAARERVAAEAFVGAAAKEPGAVVTESGLVYREVEAGTGASPKRLDRIKVHYIGTLRDGTVFDSSIERDVPEVFPLTRVIRCWTEGIQLMKVGGKAVIHCPNKIAYVGQSKGMIPPGAALRFEVELLAIED